MLPISVIICTHNPRLDLLSWTLESVAAQTLDLANWELILVDNHSTPPVTLKGLLPDRLKPITRLMREEELGLTAARCAGIGISMGEIIVFVDDDNQLAGDYLENVTAIAAEHRELGCFGGKSDAFFECKPAHWLQPVLPNLGIRDYGLDPIFSRKIDWGPWEPIGAGMVIRRAVGIAFADFCRQQKDAHHLGRKGNSLASCEDSLIAFLSTQLGFANGYHPALKLVHFIKDRRVLPAYFANLMLAMGDSHRRLQYLKNADYGAVSRLEAARALADTFPFRLQQMGDAGYIQWLWDVGHTQAHTPMDWPRITVVIPCFNSGATLRRTMESLRAQAYPNLEVIVQDGASTDDTLAILKEYMGLVTDIESVPDRGQTDAINRGFLRSTGEIRAWLCSDDEYRPGALYYAATQFILNPDCDFFVGGCLRIYPDGSSTVVRPEPHMLPQLGYKNFIDQPATFWRKELQEKAGPLDESLSLAFDWEYWNRLVQKGAKPMIFPHAIAVYYFSESNKTSVAGSNHVRELSKIITTYGPLNGRLAKVYNFLYDNFDLAGCYDSPPSAPATVMRRYHIAIKRLAHCYGEEVIYAYNWNYASKQARQLTWYR